MLSDLPAEAIILMMEQRDYAKAVKANERERNITRRKLLGRRTAAERRGDKAEADRLTTALVLLNASGVPLDPRSDEFLNSFAWKHLRMVALKHYGTTCHCCGATPQDGATINVDHIKPRSRYPHLALVLNNLQILCSDCNAGKGNWDETDWRKPAGTPPAEGTPRPPGGNNDNT